MHVLYANHTSYVYRINVLINVRQSDAKVATLAQKGNVCQINNLHANLMMNVHCHKDVNKVPV